MKKRSCVSIVAATLWMVLFTGCGQGFYGEEDYSLEGTLVKSELDVESVTASSDDGNGPENTLDDSLDTRWSSEGEGEYITFDLGSSQTVAEVEVAFYKGASRSSYFEIWAGDSTSSLSQILDYTTSSGTTVERESYDVADSTVRYVRIVGYGNSSNDWNSITEVDLESSDKDSDDEDDEDDDDDDDDRDEGVLRTVYCDSASEIHDAFNDAEAGDKIVISSGTYKGEASSSVSGSSSGYFYLNADGTEENPIWVVSEESSDPAELMGSSIYNDYVLYLKGDHIIIDSLNVSYGKKGIVMDQSDYVVIDNVEVYDTGEEGIHVRDGSSYTLIEDSYIHDTGQYNEEYGEGIYVGSDYSKWECLGGSYEKECDYVEIINNSIGPDVTAEHIDYKEGCSYVVIDGNTFDGEGICDEDNGGTSFIDMKGNYGEVLNNVGYQNENSLVEHAFEVHDKYQGWGDGNSFHDNVVYFDDDNSDSYLVLVEDVSSVDGEPDDTSAYDNTRSPSGNMYCLE
ncbi:MAG: discoidin domain-containing protein [Spirochaetales bacterium]|nr:discoidin domain-containing protein [Spirochaetales bacterium]